MAQTSVTVPEGFNFLSAHTCIAPGGGFFGKVIARRANSRQGIVIFCDITSTRAQAMGLAKRKAIEIRELIDQRTATRVAETDAAFKEEMAKAQAKLAATREKFKKI
jgi:hypothetical protein